MLKREDVQKDINENRNHSWFKEICNRHQEEMDRKVIEYYGNNISYNKIYEEAVEIAKALKTCQINQNDEVILFTDRIPEFVYIMSGVNIVGGIIHFVSEKFDQNYLKQIILNSKAKLIFIQDQKLAKLKPLIDELGLEKKIVTFSHKRSFIKNKYYQSVLNLFYEKKSPIIKDNYLNYDDFKAQGKDYKENVFVNASLDDAFTITYSSGSTKKGHPKGIVHTNRHYITMGRYHDPEVSGVPSLKNLTTYSNIPVYSNTYISSSLSDNLIMGGKVVLDPIDNPDYFLLGMKLHQSNMNVATTSVWLKTAFNYYENNRFNIHTLPSAMFNFAGGEQLSAGEEKFLNKFLKDTKSGTALSHTPFSLAKMCTAGADCEHGSIFFRILRDYYNKLPYRINRKEPIGMQVYDFVDIQVLRPDGTYCMPLEHGRLVVNSDCSMKEYAHEPEETKEFYIKDAYGKTWGNMNVYGFLDEKHNVSMKGRFVTDNSIPGYLIADEILKDTKKIMSCEVITLKENDNFIYVAHILPQYNTSFNEEKVLKGALRRCIAKFGDGIENILYFRVRNDYPLAASSKRDISALKEEGIKKAVKVTNQPSKEHVRKRVK